MYRPWLLVAMFLVMLAPGGLSTLPLSPNAEALRATSSISFPVTPAPSACVVQPRTASSILALLGTPSATPDPISDTSANTTSAVSIPIGRPPSQGVEESIIATVYELQACFNAGEPRRALALATDDFLRRFVEAGALTAQEIAFFTSETTPTPIEERPVLLAVTDITILPEGRAGAFVITDVPYIGPQTGYMMFVKQDEKWLVDETIDFL